MHHGIPEGHEEAEHDDDPEDEDDDTGNRLIFFHILDYVHFSLKYKSIMLTWFKTLLLERDINSSAYRTSSVN